VEGISRDYPLKTRSSKQPTGEILGYKIIPSHPLKYPRSKQGLREAFLLIFPPLSRTRKSGKRCFPTSFPFQLQSCDGGRTAWVGGRKPDSCDGIFPASTTEWRIGFLRWAMIGVTIVKAYLKKA
jgi:hypothetical protein